jgi:hypothetical protein
MVKATHVVVASRIDPNAAKRSNGSLNALLTINGPRMRPIECALSEGPEGDHRNGDGPGMPM